MENLPNEYNTIAGLVARRVDLSPLANKRVMVTGANGLLGSHIVNILLSNAARLNLEVYAVVRNRVYPGQRPHKVVFADLSNPGDCERLPFADVVISAASYAQPKRFLAEPLAALRSSGLGVMALLERVRPGGRFLYISSSEVYCDGRPAGGSFTEDEIGKITPYHPRACYIIGKQFGEAMTYLYNSRGISTVAVRPGITYGPGFRRGDKRSWAEFIQRAIEQGQIALMDAGGVQRTFCYMTDGMEMLFNVLCYGTQPVYNMSGSETMSIADLANVVGEACQVPVIIPDDGEGVGGTPDSLRMDNARYISEFGKGGWTNIRDGIGQTVDWAKRDLYA